jgi:hypothetical protein
MEGLTEEVNQFHPLGWLKSLSLGRYKEKIMRTGNVVSKELLSHLVLLEAEHQGKVLLYIKRLLGKEEILDEGLEMNQRASSSERDIASGRVKRGNTFKRDFEQWQKKKRANMKS